MINANDVLEVEQAAVESQVPQAKEWISSAIREASASGLSQETIVATLFIEALGRMGTRQGPLALAVILGNLAAKFAGGSGISHTIN